MGGRGLAHSKTEDCVYNCLSAVCMDVSNVSILSSCDSRSKVQISQISAAVWTSSRSNFHDLLASLVRYLYDKSIHPQIKGGELYVAYLKNCVLEDELVDAVGIFKTENNVFREMCETHSFSSPG